MFLVYFFYSLAYLALRASSLIHFAERAGSEGIPAMLIDIDLMPITPKLILALAIRTPLFKFRDCECHISRIVISVISVAPFP